MLRKKTIYITSTCILSIFFTLIIYFVYCINHENAIKDIKIATEETIESILHEIRVKALNLPEQYTTKKQIKDELINTFQKNLTPKGTINYKQLWNEFDTQINNNQIFDTNNSNIGNIIQALKTAKVLSADVYSKGTQLKLILELEDKHFAVFKPQWYEKERVILGNVYAGKDRTGAEILAFYLAGILNLRLVPILAERSVDIKKEILPVASSILNKTKFEYKDKTCIYGKCYYCKKEDPVCTNDEGKITGAIIFYISEKLKSYNSPWQRTYKKDKQALWETNPNYCSIIMKKISNKRLLDLIDVSIFDFLIQNGDRHHYEVLQDKVILLDNGKGLGNPYVHHLDILAPLYQCCMIRQTTWDRLIQLSGGVLTSTLQSFQDVKNVIWEPHFKAIEERLLMIYATVEICKIKNELLLY